MARRDDATNADLSADGGALPPQVGVPTRKPKEKSSKFLTVDPPKVAVLSANPSGDGVTARAPQVEQQREIRLSSRIMRVDATRKVVFGEVYVPFDPQPAQTYPIEAINDLVDSWGTFMRPATVEELAHAYLRFSRNVDQQHDEKTRAGEPVESFIADDKSEFVPGAWVMAVKVGDDIWPKVASGELKGFSIDVLAGRIPTAVKVTGSGKTVDLNGVVDPPFFPKEITVEGEATLRLDEIVDCRPFFVSLVSAAANHREFAKRSAEVPIVRFHPESTMPVEQRKAVPYKSTPEGKEEKWDGAAATGRLRSWAGVDADEPTDEAWSKYAQGFAQIEGDAKNLGSYKLPHHDVEDGKLVLSRAGLLAAGGAVQGARGGMDLGDDAAAVKAHLEKHYHALDLKAPWESDDEKKSSLTVEVRDGKAVITLDDNATLEDAKPATKSWLRRLFGWLVDRDENALRPDGTPPPAIAASLPPVPPKVAVPINRKETPMSTKTEPRSAIVLRRHQAHLNRYAGDGGSPMEFGDEWEKEDYTEELSDASWLLFDVLSSIWYNYDSYASWDAMLQAMAKAMNEYLAAVAAIPQEVDKDQAVVAARSMVTRMALGCSVPLAVISRAGKKYSTETAAKLKAAHEKMEAAYNEMCAIMADVDGAAGDNGGEVAPPENSGDGKQKDGAPAGTQPAEGDKDKQLQAAAPAVAAVAASAASTGTAPAVAATSTAAPAPAAAPAPTEAQRALDDAKRDLADVNKRLAAIDGAPAPAAPTVAAPPVEDPVLVEAKRVRAEVEAAKNKIEEIEKRRAGSAQVASSGNASAPAPATATSETKRTWDGGIVFGPTSVRPKDNG